MMITVSFIQRDYIMRIIEQLCGVILHVVGLRRSGQEQQAFATIEQEAERVLGIDIAVLRTLSQSDAVETMRTARLTRPDASDAEWWITLAIFLEEATLLQQQDEPKAAQQTEQLAALALDHVPLDETSTETLAQLIATYDATEPLPASIRTVLWLHHERLGAYDQAEDWLFDLLESESLTANLLHRAAAFYHRLEAHSDEDLVHGGLPRSEVQEGLEHVLALSSPTARGDLHEPTEAGI